MAKPASPHKATGKDHHVEAAGDRDPDPVPSPPPPAPADPYNQPPSRGGGGK